ncbi:LysR family transcriptional regulator [Frateuria aurantia]
MSITPNFLALRLFLRVAELRNFSAVAAEFNLPPSSVTRHIGNLEQQLQQALFHRHPRAVRLTQAGARYYDAVASSIQRIDQASDEVASNEHLSGLLRINAPPAFAKLHLSRIAHEYQKINPGIDIDALLADTFMDPVDAGIDISIRIGDLTDSNLIARPLAVQRFVLCASREYLDHHEPIHRPEDLIRHNCLLYQGPRGAQKWHFRRSADEPYQTLELQGNLKGNHAEYLLEAALAGQGLVLFASWLVGHLVNAGRIVRLLPEYEWAIEPRALTIHAIYPSTRGHSVKMRSFLEHLQQRIGSPAYWDIDVAMTESGTPDSTLLR